MSKEPETNDNLIRGEYNDPESTNYDIDRYDNRHPYDRAENPIFETIYIPRQAHVLEITKER